MLNKINNLIVNEEGQGMSEYGLVLGAIALGAVVALLALRTQIAELLNSISTKITTAANGIV